MSAPEFFPTSTPFSNPKSGEIQFTESPHWNNLSNVHYVVLAGLLACVIPCFTKTPLLRRGALFLQAACVLQSFIAPPKADEKNTAVLYTSGVLLGIIAARSFDRLYVHVPEEEFHRIDRRGVREDVRSLSLIQRFLWGFELFIVTRGVGWDWRVAGIPKQGPQTRAQFLKIRAVKYIAMYTGLYLTSVVSQAVLDGFPLVSNPTLREMLISATSNTVFLYVLIALGWAMTIYSHFGLLMLPIGFICVGLKVGPKSWQEVEAWPPNFGSLKEAYSIRRFWGYTWHQQVRRTAAAPGAFVFSHFPTFLQKGRSLPVRLFRRYFLILGSFFISGCIHACGTYNVTRALHLPLSTGGDIKFYLAQGAALIAEDFACWILGVNDQVSEPSRLRKVLGYFVTATFHIWSRVVLKGVPIAIAQGYRDDRGVVFAALKAMQVGAAAVPGNFISIGVQWLMKAN